MSKSIENSLTEHTRSVKGASTEPLRRRHPTGRVSKEQWLSHGLKALSEGGLSTVQVEALAVSLEISRSGFYWHFKNRKSFLEELADYWANEFTKEIIDKCEAISATPMEKILSVSQIIRQNRADRYDLSFWNWAQTDPAILSIVEDVRDARVRYIRSLIESIGFSGVELEARTRLFVVFHSWGSTMFDTRATGPETDVTDTILSVILAP